MIADLTIISGGQTGADRAALDWCLHHNVRHRGWCPKGRWAEDGAIDARYALSQTPLSNPAQRTEWNVRDSDGTVVFSIGKTLSGGSRLTVKFARQYRRPLLHLHSDSANPARRLKAFIRQHQIHVLNVAGPRASQEPAIGKFVSSVLDECIRKATRRPQLTSKGPNP